MLCRLCELYKTNTFQSFQVTSLLWMILRSVITWSYSAVLQHMEQTYIVMDARDRNSLSTPSTYNSLVIFLNSSNNPNSSA